MVAIADGASCIRADLVALFGALVMIMLDWYHPEKRDYGRLSISAYFRIERGTLTAKGQCA